MGRPHPEQCGRLGFASLSQQEQQLTEQAWAAGESQAMIRALWWAKGHAIVRVCVGGRGNQAPIGRSHFRIKMEPMERLLPVNHPVAHMPCNL